jgi:hypothetical protein
MTVELVTCSPTILATLFIEDDCISEELKTRFHTGMLPLKLLKLL